MSHIRIALVAPKGTGKTTFSQSLSTWYGFNSLALADPIKFSIVHAVNAFLTDQRIEPLITPSDLSINKEAFRLGMQWLGTDIVRDLCGRKTHWIENLLSRISSIEAHCDELQQVSAIVVDDVRFTNEADILRERGFKLIRLFRESEIPPDTHKSENELYGIQCDEVIKIGETADDTIEAAKHFGLEEIKTSLHFSAAQGNVIAQEWLKRFESFTESEIQQELRQVGGIYRFKTAWR
jgi:hypothetical protein